VVLDYFAQDQAAVLTGVSTVYEEMSAASPTTMVPMIRNILGGFLFSGDDVNKRVAVLSGGERNRLALAKMLLNASNLLLLDEPTNHLDLDSKEVLLDALDDYGGTLVFVSHDRYFVDRLATKVIEVGAGEAPLYPGGYEDFLYWKRQRAEGRQASAHEATRERDLAGGVTAFLPAPPPRPKGTEPVEARIKTSRPAPAAKTASKTAPAPPAPRDPMAPRLRPAGAAPERQLVEREAKKTKARIAELEKRIAEKERAVKDLEARMATPGFYDDRAAAEKVVAEHKVLMWEVGDLMGQWEMLQS
jgi:ATP-binding cassette subfamily F protein 3